MSGFPPKKPCPGHSLLRGKARQGKNSIFSRSFVEEQEGSEGCSTGRAEMPSNGKSWNYPSKIPFSQVLKPSAFLEAGIRISQLSFWDFGKEKPPWSIVAQSNLFRSCKSRFSSQSLCWESLFGRRKKGKAEPTE